MLSWEFLAIISTFIAMSLERRINASPVALAKGYTASPGPTGTEAPRNEEIDD